MKIALVIGVVLVLLFTYALCRVASDADDQAMQEYNERHSLD